MSQMLAGAAFPRHEHKGVLVKCTPCNCWGPGGVRLRLFAPVMQLLWWQHVINVPGASSSCHVCMRVGRNACQHNSGSNSDPKGCVVLHWAGSLLVAAARVMEQHCMHTNACMWQQCTVVPLMVITSMIFNICWECLKPKLCLGPYKQHHVTHSTDSALQPVMFSAEVHGVKLSCALNWVPYRL